ncbi:unnamed protein product [Calypogeia fissa]
MDPAVLTVRAKYAPVKKGPVIAGVLMMTETRFKWVSNDPKASSAVDHPFTVIKAHFFNKGTKKALLNLSKGGDAKADGFVFEFDSFPDRDICRDHVAKILGKQNPSAGVPSGGQPFKPAAGIQAGGQSAKPSAPSFSPQVDQFDQAEMERRMKLLQTDSELQKLHSQLVMGGVLSEADFWNARKHMLDDEADRAPKQRTGLKSAMLADVRPLTDGRTNKVTFNLTPEIIHQIFAEKPAVHRAFLLNVPNKMSEVEFWTKYCRAEYLYRTKNQAAAAAEAADDEDLALFTKEDDIILSESQRKIKKVDPTLDMGADLADDYTHLPGHGILRDGNKEPEEMVGPRKRSIMNDINRHAAVVLDGCPLDALENAKDTASVAQALAIAQQVEAERNAVDFKTRRLERIHQMTVNEDLEGPHEPELVPLCIQDPRKYFDSQQSGATGDAGPHGPTSSDPSEALECFHEQLAAFKRNGLPETVMTPDIAMKVMNDLNRDVSATRYTLGKTAEKNVLDNLPRAMKDDVLQQSATGNELLRHFWASYPLTSPALVNKVNRLKEAMSQHYSRIQGIKDAAPAEHRHHISQLLHPMLQALDAAFAHYEEHPQRRAAKTGTKHAPNGQQNGVFSPNLVTV